MKGPQYNEHLDEAALRQAVEKQARRSLSDAEWTMIAPDWSEPYGDGDVADLVNAVRDSLPPQPKLSPDHNARLGRRAHTQQVALKARDMVEAFRRELFEHDAPPFRNHLGQAAQWIEAQAREQEFKNQWFSIKVLAPAPLDDVGCLIWLRDYLNENLGSCSLADNNDGPDNPEQALVACDEILSMSCESPMLEYLGVNPAGEKIINCVDAPDGTLLGRLRSRAEELVKATNWQQYAAVHHLLTGGISVPSAVIVTSQFRNGRQYFGDTYPMTLTISDPGSVTEQDVVTALRRARSNNSPPWRRRQRQRGRVASKSKRVAAFVEERPKMLWSARLEEWNRRNPDERFRTTSAMKQAYSRGTRH